jgi:hypothetical protein
MALHATLRVADLHADSLLLGRDLLARGDRGHVDVPRLIEGRVALQVLSCAMKVPRTLSMERNADTGDMVLALALAAAHVAEHPRPGAVHGRAGARARGPVGREVPVDRDAR